MSSAFVDFSVNFKAVRASRGKAIRPEPVALEILDTPVDTCHPDYEAHRDEWCLMRDVSAGHKAVQAKGEVYLPNLSDPEEYQAYKKRATFFNATGRVVDALTGNRRCCWYECGCHRAR